MDEKRIQTAKEVANSNKDIKELIGSYNFHKSMAKDYRREDHPFLQFKDENGNSRWTNKDLIDKAEWHEQILNILTDRLEKKGIMVNDIDFFDGTEFIPKEAPKLKYIKGDGGFFERIEDGYCLETDLRASDKIKELVKDDIFAQQLYAAMCNMDWVKENIHWSCSWRYSGGIVADLRNLGEDYLNFYCSGMFIDYEDEQGNIHNPGGAAEGTVTEQVRTVLKELGWEPREYIS